MATRIGINGFGRIGRQVLKALLERHKGEVDVVGINDLFDTAIECRRQSIIDGPVATEHEGGELGRRSGKRQGRATAGEHALRHRSEKEPGIRIVDDPPRRRTQRLAGAREADQLGGARGTYGHGGDPDRTALSGATVTLAPRARAV